jgi:DNA-binding ferritin-like protein (Dps family)
MEKILEQLRKKYTLEQSKKSVEEIVIPRFMRLSLERAVERFNTLPEEYRTDWSKLFMDVDLSRGVLKTLIQSLFGLYGGELIGLAELDMTIAERKVTHIFANTKDKTQQGKFVKLIREVLGGDYLVELINSDETNNREVEQKVKGLVNQAKRENKRIVLVSKDMASRSFSIPEIDTVMLMFDRGSYSTIAQKISRVLTPGKTLGGDTKVYGNIISLSLDPNREDVSPIDEYIIYESEKVEGDDLNDSIQRVLRSVQLFTNGQNGEVEIEKDEYSNRLINSSSLIRMGSESSKVEHIINDTELVKQLLGVEVTKGEIEKLLGVNSGEVKRTIGGEKTKEEKQVEKKVEDIRIKLKEVLKNIVENVVIISQINRRKSNDIIETLDMINEKGLNKEVVIEVGVDCETIKKIILIGGISRKLLNTIITSYNSENIRLF